LYYSQITTVIAGKGLTVTDGVMSVNEEDSKYPHTFIKGNSADYVERNNDFVLLDTNEITK
jgi:hypothetical protein